MSYEGIKKVIFCVTVYMCVDKVGIMTADQTKHADRRTYAHFHHIINETDILWL